MATLSTIEYTANPEAPAFNMGANVKKFMAVMQKQRHYRQMLIY